MIIKKMRWLSILLIISMPVLSMEDVAENSDDIEEEASDPFEEEEEEGDDVEKFLISEDTLKQANEVLEKYLSFDERTYPKQYFGRLINHKLSKKNWRVAIMYSLITLANLYDFISGEPQYIVRREKIENELFNLLGKK